MFNHKNGVARQNNRKTAVPLISWAALFLLTIPACAAGGLLPVGAGATAIEVSTDSQASNTINITSGGTYSGNWTSNDPSTPAVLITTDQPVTIQNSTVTGPGNLIVLNGKSMADLTLRNVTGTGLDPMVSGQARGSFLRAFSFKSLVVQNCTMSGTAFGVLAGYGTAQNVRITNNVAYGLEDRASDGKGGFLTTRPSYGHFIQLTKLSAPNGAEIAWNQLKQTIGTTSTEDAISLYLSQGTASQPLWVHDNYMEGYSSPATSNYSGYGVVADGDNTGNSAYMLFQANQMVHTGGGGVAIASGHDVTVQNNRVVSCGQDANGNVYTKVGANAVELWNYYKASNFYNNTITTTAGGLMSLNSNRTLVPDDVFAVTVDQTDTVANNNFTDPCLQNGALNLGAEDDERAYWANKLQTNSIVLGDQHQQS